MINVYSIHDVKAEAYNLPFFKSTDGLAIRAFAGLVNSPDTEVSLSPSDFSLYQVGVFDQTTGEISPVTPPRFVSSATSLLKDATSSLNDSVVVSDGDA